MTKKSKIIMIAAIAAAVVLVAAGAVIAVVLSNGYLDSLKDYDVESNYSFNGVEILEEDGLYYLTKEGKKLSETGYTYLTSVNNRYVEMKVSTFATYDDVEIYDWYLARKTDVEELLLVNTEGEEYTIAGENLEVVSATPPYIVLKDTHTFKYGVISLKNFDSALSSVSDKEITLNMYDSIDGCFNVNDGAQYDYIVVYDEGNGTDAAKYVYFNENGNKIVESYQDDSKNTVSTYDICDKEGIKTRYFYDSVNAKLCNINGDAVANDVVSVWAYSDEVLLVTCDPEDDENLTEEANADKQSAMFVSYKTSITLSAASYDLENSHINGNLFWTPNKTDSDTAAVTYKLFNIVTGESTDIKYGIKNVATGLVRITLNETADSYMYVETETGAELCTSKYDDMDWYNYNEGVLCSPTEYGEKVANITDINSVPVAYLHFVDADKDEVALTLEFGETLTKVLYNESIAVYKITSFDTLTSTDYSITQNTLYIPFAATAKTAEYDDIQYLGVFADGAGIALATDYDAGKYDFIDVATGSIIKTVTAAGADMAKTTFSHYNTYNLRQDNTKEESTVEYAVIKMIKTDDMGNTVSTDYFAISRNNPQTKDSDIVTSAATVVSLGKDLVGIERYTGHLVVHTTKRSSTVYTVSDSYDLTELVSLSYKVYGINYNSNDIDDIYIKVVDDQNNYGLYAVDGTQILAPVYSSVYVADDGYIVVGDKGAFGAFKYNAEKGKTKQILDLEFDYVAYMADGGFAVLVGCDWYIYDEGDLVKSDKVIGYSLDEDDPPINHITDYSIDEETGVLTVANNYYMNIGGKLYIHRTEGKEVLGVKYVAKTVDDNVTIESSGVKVVNFRDAEGKIIETQVVYPTAKSAFEFKMPEGTWYTTPVEDLQESVITGITNLNNSIINLYKGEAAVGDTADNA